MLTRPHTLVVRLDNAGDVLLSGPAVRAVAAGSRRVSFLCGPNGEAAAHLLPAVDHVEVHRAAWIDPDPAPLDRADVLELTDRVAELGPDTGVVFTSFHQSALPTALVLRMAGVRRVAAISVDYPGALLDVRHHCSDDIHEVERSLGLAVAAGFPLPAGDDGRLAVRPEALVGEPPMTDPYVVVHPGASVPARAWSAPRCAALVQILTGRGWQVVVTGGPSEARLTAAVAGDRGVDMGGATDLAGLARVVAGAEVIVTGNTGPAHLAAAVGTPVVSLYAPTVPAVRWRPWMVPHVLLGRQDIGCAGCRARLCPVAGHPCIDAVEPETVADSVESLAGVRA